MNRNLFHIGATFLVFAVFGCAVTSVPKKTVSTGAEFNYSDDISQYRPALDAQPLDEADTQKVIDNRPIETSYDIKQQLGAVIDSMLVRNDTVRLYDGYTILVYSGNNEIEAGRVRNRLFDIVPDMEAKFSYNLPTYFVKVGEFFQQVEAQTLFRKIRTYYPTAAIVPEKFSIEDQ